VKVNRHPYNNNNNNNNNNIPRNSAFNILILKKLAREFRETPGSENLRNLTLREPC
jgi:hypothetical protein